MILLETSVFIDHLRGKDPKLPDLFAQLPLAVCGATRAEVIAGHKSTKQRVNEVTVLDGLIQLSTPEAVWDRLGDHLAALRAGGVNVPFADVLIATIAIAADVELWTRDRHYALVQQVLPALKLFAEPP
jgi:predicted nucleic acid-binding protein